MPIHDWSKVDAGVFHHFHLQWIATLSDSLNGGVLPSDYYALAEQQFGGFGPDVLSLKNPHSNGATGKKPKREPGIVIVARPKTRFAMSSSRPMMSFQDEKITIRHVSDDEVVAVIGLFSPGNKSSQKRFQSFLDKSLEFLQRQIHLVIIDLFPPTKRDPNGVHGAIWDEIGDQPFALPAESPLTVVSYEAADIVNAFVEAVAIGDPLPNIPLFLKPKAHVCLDLESTYQQGYNNVPERWRAILES